MPWDDLAGALEELEDLPLGLDRGGDDQVHLVHVAEDEGSHHP